MHVAVAAILDSTALEFTRGSRSAEMANRLDEIMRTSHTKKTLHDSEALLKLKLWNLAHHLYPQYLVHVLCCSKERW